MTRADFIVQILHLLTRLRDARARSPNCGICGHVYRQLPPTVQIVWEGTAHAGFECWDEYSGNSLYPVPAPVLYRLPREAYMEARADYCTWSGEYGGARLRLVEHLIGYYEKLLAAEVQS